MKDRWADSPQDEELVRIFQADPRGAGGREAVEHLLGRWCDRVYLWCFRVVKDRELALDLAQDVCVRAYQALPGFEPRARFSSWLFMIARNRCLSALRGRPLKRDPDADPDDLIDRLARHEEEVDQRDALENVLVMMHRNLDPVERRALWMRAVERLPVDEISVLLRIEGRSGARGVLQSARRKLKRVLADPEQERVRG